MLNCNVRRVLEFRVRDDAGWREPAAPRAVRLRRFRREDVLRGRENVLRARTGRYTVWTRGPACGKDIKTVLIC